MPSPQRDEHQRPYLNLPATGVTSSDCSIHESAAGSSVSRRKDCFSVLHVACLRNFVRVVVKLIEHKADVNSVAKDDIMPIHVRRAKQICETATACLMRGLLSLSSALTVARRRHRPAHRVSCIPFCWERARAARGGVIRRHRRRSKAFLNSSSTGTIWGRSKPRETAVSSCSPPIQLPQTGKLSCGGITILSTKLAV